jgi:hypothetical protein
MTDANSSSIQRNGPRKADSRQTSQEIQHSLWKPKVCPHPRPEEPHSSPIHPNCTRQFRNHFCTLARSACYLLHAGFFLRLFLEPEDVCVMFLQNRLHCVTSQKTEIFIRTGVRISNPTYSKDVYRLM